MYHGRFKNTHYQAGFHWGEMLRKHGNFIHKQHTFQITEERKKFAMRCLPVYEKYYPEVLKEIKGIADGQQSSYEDLCTFLLSMYCFEFSNHCTCFAFRDQEHIVFGRNSDFLTELEKLYMDNALARLMIETINNVLIEIYASLAQAEMEKKEKRQREGMEAKKLRGEWDEVGRPRAIEPEKFNQEFLRVIEKEVTPTQLQRELGLTASTFYRYRKDFFEKFPQFVQFQK